MSEKNVSVAVLGEGAVGKTCTIIRLVRGVFVKEYVPSIHDVFEKNFSYQGSNWKMQLIDTAGQDELEAVCDMCITDAEVFILMYSVKSVSSFDKLDKLYDRVTKLVQNGTPKVIIAGNMCDLPQEDHYVSTEQGRRKAEAYNAPFFECSALEDVNISPLFEKALELAADGQSGKKGGSKKGGGEGGCCEVA